MARLWVPDGVVRGVLNGMVPSFASGQITVTSGAAWLDGHYVENDAPAVTAVGADGLLVLRYTYAGSAWAFAFKSGAGAVPVQDATVYEIPIAFMAAGAMTDRRWLNDGMGGPRGVLGYAQRVDADSAVGPAKTGLLTVGPVTVPAGRRLRLHGHLIVTVPTAGAIGIFGCDEVGGGLIGRFDQTTGNTAQGLDGSLYVTPPAGPHSYTMTIQSTAGNVTCHFASGPAFLTIEDVGPV
jgi:hypothetical protein